MAVTITERFDRTLKFTGQQTRTEDGGVTPKQGFVGTDQEAYPSTTLSATEASSDSLQLVNRQVDGHSSLAAGDTLALVNLATVTYLDGSLSGMAVKHVLISIRNPTGVESVTIAKLGDAAFIDVGMGATGSITINHSIDFNAYKRTFAGSKLMVTNPSSIPITVDWTLIGKI